jgi:hypothetical protein
MSRHSLFPPNPCALRWISSGVADPGTSHVAQLPVVQSTYTFPVPKNTFTAPPSRPATTDAEFMAACQDQTLCFSPRRLGFIPGTMWTDEETTFGNFVSEFFQRKNNANCRFSHKLFNALTLGEFKPIYQNFTGVSWLTESILRVDKRVFARLLGIKSIDGSLFHQQGNFPSHGFFEIGSGDHHRFVPPGVDLTGVDFENVRLLIHPRRQFRKGCTSKDIEKCKWANWRIRK